MLLAVIAVTLAAIGWAALSVNLAEHRRLLQENALKEVEILSRAYSQQLHRSVEAIDQMTLYVKHGWESSGGKLKLEQARNVGLFQRSSGIYVSIFDERGALLASTVRSPGAENIANEPYFQAQVNGPGKFYIGTAKIGRISHIPIIPFSRRLSDAAGNFRGIVVAAVVPAYFMTAYDTVVLGDHGLLAILTTNNEVRLARVGERIFLPANREQSFLGNLDFDPAGGSTLLNGDRWFADGRSRYTGWQTTPEYDLLAMAGLDASMVEARYEAIRGPAVRSAIGSSIALAVLTVVAMLVFVDVARRKEQFKAMQAGYRIATEGAVEGFLIAVPNESHRGKPLDFQIADCNERGAQLLGYRRDDLVGKTVSSLDAGKLGRSARRLLRQAFSAHLVQQEINLAKWNPQGPAWLKVRIVRNDGNLAITMEDISKAKAHLTELERRGNEDALTGLPNRHWVNSYLPNAIEAATENGSMMALLFLDLDDFKIINDTLGHEAGDETLRAVGQRLKTAVRPRDHVVRLGGDEFLVVLERIAGEDDAAYTANRILTALRPPVSTASGDHNIGTTIGISVFPNDGTDAGTLLNHADIAMYWAKSSGKRTFAFYDPRYSEAVRTRNQLQQDVTKALDEGQLVVWYQPRMDLSTRKVSSFEALVRWVHPIRGVIDPSEFIPLAEETGLISRVGERVIDTVCEQVAAWREHDAELVPVSINVSAYQFRNADLAGLFSSYLERYQLSPGLIEIELTESSMVDDNAAVSQALAALRSMGIKLLVDDFGTGYSSLSQLQRLRFDSLKVDRAFTRQLESSREGVALFRAIITMAHELGLRVVAEGVENASQMRILETLRCDEVQGYYISRPMPASHTQAALREISAETRSFSVHS